jgi:hypothetical protein
VNLRIAGYLQGRTFNVVVATVVTALIWNWAYDATRASGDATGKIAVRAPADSALHVEPATPTTVLVKFSGPRSAVRAAQQVIGAGIELTLGTGDVPATPGEQVLDLSRILALRPELQRLAISVDATSPAQLRFRALELTTVTARVTTDLAESQVVGQVSIEPEDVSITIPKDALSALPELRPMAVVDAAALERGRRHSVDADVTLWRVPARWADAVRISPPRVRVAFTLRSNVRSATLASVPVQVAAPPAQLAAFDAVPAAGSETLRQVAVSGPAEAITALEDGSARVVAVVSLGSDDFAPGTISRRVAAWISPPGVTVLRVGDVPAAAVEVTVKVAPRESR